MYYQVLNPARSDKEELYLCMKCFRQLEKLTRLRKESALIEESLKDGLKKVAERRQLPVKTTPSRRKRPAVSASPSQPATKRQRGLDTPTRKSLQQIQESGTPSVSVVVKRQNKSRLFRVSNSLKSLVKGAGRRSRSSIAFQAMQDVRIRKKVVERMGKLMSKEMTSLTSLKVGCVLRNCSGDTLKEFVWKDLLQELEKEAPVSLSLFKQCAHVKRRGHTQRGKSGRSARRSPDEETAVGMCFAILLRSRSQRMSLVQRLVSMLLYGSHAPKQLYRRLNKLLLCMSHKSTLNFVDKLGMNHDQEVLQWRDDIWSRKLAPQADGGPSSVDADKQQDSTTLHPPVDDSQPISQDNEFISSSTSTSELESVEESSEEATSNGASTSDNPSTSDSVCSLESSVEEDMLAIFGPETSYAPNASSLKTFKVVGDNVDTRIKPTQYRIDSQAKDLHYFHTIAVRDRIDLSDYSDTPPEVNETDLDLSKIELSDSDHEALTKNFSYLVARVLKEYMPFFASFGSGLEKHIRHQYYEEMSLKSEVVPLGILLKNESSYEDMVDIMKGLHPYVPTETTQSTQTIPGSDTDIEVVKDTFHIILFGGDQMTVARARGSQRIRKNSERAKDRLEGLTPVCEDWHAKLCFLGVIWRRLYSASSMMDGGTMYQLRNLINRRNMVNNPKQNEAAYEDFMITVTEAHILSAAMTLFKMESLTDVPDKSFFPEGSSDLDSLQRRNIFMLATLHLVEKHVDLLVPDKKPKKFVSTESYDGVLQYAQETLTLGLLLMEFNDAIRKGDGGRIMRCWKFFLPIFKSGKRTNYSIEAFTLLAQYHYLFSPRMAAQLAWSRTINTHGRPGKNIPCDLHLEHLNRQVKNALGGLCSNVTDQSVTKIGKSIGVLSEVSHHFDATNRVPTPSTYHTSRPKVKDIKMIVEQLKGSKVFEFQKHRQHRHFKNFTRNPCTATNKVELNNWMTEQMKKLLADHN